MTLLEAPKKASYRILEHTADVGIEVHASSREAIFEEACVALFELIGRPSTLADSVEGVLRVEGLDAGDLLVRLLTEMLALFELRSLWLEELHCLSLHVPVSTAEQELLWELELSYRGRSFDRSERQEMTEVKAITYHQLRFEAVLGSAEGEESAFVAQVIFDL
ncbi:MAG: archease [Myxococcota bacterium]|jgi:SHS2 domain-containing protein|nr:archease [Myxococcota bacterium]